MPELPTGVVTFLLTDIEGSTRLWAAHPEAMRAALARHDALVGAAIAEHGGTLLKRSGEGDSLFSVFARASSAAAAAAAIQRALAAEPWPFPDSGDGPRLRVRIALHAGEAELREGDYYGGTVNRCARLRSVAHGGQVLLSLAMEQLVREMLPPGVEVRDLGEHRLRSLTRPERIFQLVIPGLPAEFPPLRNPERRPLRLPIPPTPLIGRDAELAAITALLSPDREGRGGAGGQGSRGAGEQRSGGGGSSPPGGFSLPGSVARLVTLTGPGGTGKTRLALQAAAELVDRFDSGVQFVPLASVNDAALVAASIAEALEIRELGGRSPLQSLKAYIQDKELLLVLDNFEQVVEAAPVVGELLAACPRLNTLVTSREVLRIYGEREFPVPPLALPEIPTGGQPPASAAVLSKYAAVELFIQRAQAARPGFSITDESAPAVVEICARLDGLPLAIELAAARIRLLPPRALLARLARPVAGNGGRPLDDLGGGARDLPDRHRTLRSAIAWSYDLLPPEEQLLFRRLAVFTGGCTLEAAEAVAGGGMGAGMLDCLASLVDKSLLRQEEHGDEEARFVMLETIREYGLECLEVSGATEAVRARHAQYFVGVAEAAEPRLTTAEQGMSLQRLEMEHDNLRAAVAWALARGEGEVALRLAGALAWFWNLRGYLSEGRSWLDDALSTANWEARVREGPELSPLPDVSHAAVARGLLGAGALALYHGDYAAARERLSECLAVRLQEGDRAGAAYPRMFLGSLARMQGDYPAAQAQLDESARAFREAGDRWGLAMSLTVLGVVTRVRENHAAARALLEESLALWRQLGDRWGLAKALNSLGEVARSQGDYDSARHFYAESRTLSRELGARWEIAGSLHNLGHVALHEGDLRQAAALFREGLALYQELGSRPFIAHCVGGLAGVAAHGGESERAARLFGATAALLADAGAVMEPVDRWEWERNLRVARAALSSPDFDAAWGTGQRLSQEQAVALAMEDA
jgi:predicted ATPase/class 3 adenylate cyclase